MDKAARITRSPLEIEQNIADPLARPVIGIASAAPGLDHFEARIEQFGEIHDVLRPVLEEASSRLGLA